MRREWKNIIRRNVWNEIMVKNMIRIKKIKNELNE